MGGARLRHFHGDDPRLSSDCVWMPKWGVGSGSIKWRRAYRLYDHQVREHSRLAAVMRVSLQRSLNVTKAAVVIAIVVVTGLVWYVPHAKNQDINACRFEVSKKWNDVLDNACIQTWSPLYNKEGKTVFPTCDETAAAKKFMVACMEASGFSTTDACNADESFRFLGNCYQPSWPLQIFDSIAESDLIADSNPKPWMGYIWNSSGQRYEWLLAAFKTLGECQLAVERAVGTFSYTRPVGCGYAGNSLLRVRIVNAIYGGANYTCIAESNQPAEAEKIGMRYGPAIGPVPTDPNSWHCVDTPRNLELIKGPAYIPPPPDPTIPLDKVQVSNLRVDWECRTAYLQ
jgi:hypothetical protein